MEREVVCQCLAWMFNLTQRIDHRNAGELRDAFDGLMRERAQHDPADPALEIVCDIAERLTRIEPLMTVIHKCNCAANAKAPTFECESLPQRRLLQKHGDLLSRQYGSELIRTRLHAAGEM